MKPLISFSLIVLLSGCASYMKRQTCESTNWYDYGEKVALEGRRLSGDQFILECKQADADVAEADLDRGFKQGMERYCLPEQAFQTGKNGHFFSEEMCTGMGLNNLRIQHHNGVLQYCDRSNGYNAGSKGAPYNKICPIELEKTFLPEFNRGRKRYLQTVISQNNAQIQDLNREIDRNQSRLTFKQGLRLGIQSRLAGNKDNQQLSGELTSINNEIYTLQSSIRSSQNRLDALKEQNRKIEIEIVQLD
jgi:hypothetical protein